MTDICPLGPLTMDDCARVMTGYTTQEIYRVTYADSGSGTVFQVERVPLEQPVSHQYSHIDASTLRMYNEVAQGGFSFGAYDGDALVGFVIAERRAWNNSLWVWEFHVAGSHRGQGLGRRLMERAVEAAKAANLRTVVCETQHHNAPAIHAYRKLGFALEGIDISYYTNEDYPDSGSGIAVFMKRRL